MSNYNKQQEAILLKGIASQILSMNMPSADEFDKLFKQFNLSSDLSSSIIGRKYHPSDNSFNVDLSTAHRHGGKIRQLIAGTSSSLPEECTILTEPFFAKIDVSITNPESRFEFYRMIIVMSPNGEVHSTLFSPDNII